MLTWWREGDAAARRAWLAASLGWMLDSFDVMIYVLVLPALMPAVGFDSAMGGRLQSLTLLSAAAGGLIFGVVADRWGRTRALMGSVLLYSVFTAACGFANSALMLAVFRVFLGFGMGGEWATGAALVSETWPDRHRAKALAFMQSTWAVGYAAATAMNYLVRSVLGLDWRAMFFIGILPALLTIWVRRRVQEPERWRKSRQSATRVSVWKAASGPMLRITAALALMNACALFAYWGFNTWVPTYLAGSRASGGIGFSNATMSWLVFANQVGTWFGYVTFGYVSDVIGRKRTYVAYLLLASVLVLAYTSTENVLLLLALGPVTSFFATGFFSGFGTVTGELYPTDVRATLQGFTYNIGRVLSAFAPQLVGSVARLHGYPAALSIAAAAYVVAACFWVFIPETKGRELQ